MLEFRPSRVATGVTARPSNETLTRLEELTDVREKPHRSNQGERTDVGVWQSFVKSGGGGQDCATLRNNVVDQDNSAWLDGRVRHRERVIMSLHGGTIRVEGGRGLSDGKAALDTGPYCLSEQNAAQCYSEPLGCPHSRRRRVAARYGHEGSICAE